jgi:hypothetical protein
MTLSKYRRRRSDKWLRRSAQLAAMRTAKARKRTENSVEREPKLVRWFPLELGIRDKATGETCWIDLKSARDAVKRIAIILKYYTPGIKQ